MFWLKSVLILIVALLNDPISNILKPLTSHAKMSCCIIPALAMDAKWRLSLCLISGKKASSNLSEAQAISNYSEHQDVPQQISSPFNDAVLVRKSSNIAEYFCKKKWVSGLFKIIIWTWWIVELTVSGEDPTRGWIEPDFRWVGLH